MTGPDRTFEVEGAYSVALAGRSVFRTSARDASVLAAALMTGAGTAAVAAAVVVGPPSPAGALLAALFVALAIHWGSNTIAHIHLHSPLFRSSASNRCFSLYLTLLLRIPQTYWRARHLAHHHPHPPCNAGRERPQRRVRLNLWTAVEWALVAGLPFAAWLVAPRLFVVLAVGQLLGFGLCFLQGHYEHQGIPAGVDYYGSLYNRLWFNDGYHTAHHRWPDRHWTLLPSAPAPAGPVQSSAWPPVVRWIDQVTRGVNRVQAAALDFLERAAQRSDTLRRFQIASHRRSFAALLRHNDIPAGAVRIGIVGGGLFPRTAMVLRQLRPDARLVLIDVNAAHLAQAAARLGEEAKTVGLLLADFPPEGLASSGERFDVVVIPLAYRGDRSQLYRRPPAPVTFIHDWMWRRRGQAGRRISWCLLKRLNLVIT